jgi:ABC-type multidrug transport system fused ATPase/permease subunit
MGFHNISRSASSLDLPQEPLAIIDSKRAPAYWPSSSNNNSLLVVENLTIKYAPELPSVLHDISFILKAGERVGLLGRTGSGKSTLAMSILRFVCFLTFGKEHSSHEVDRLILQKERSSLTALISQRLAFKTSDHEL